MKSFTVRSLPLCLGALSLVACTTNGSALKASEYYSYQQQDVRYYEPAYDDSDSSHAIPPDASYVGASSPRPHTEVDRSWVRSQNPQAYTIQIDESEKASQVAGKLYKTPKTDRAAQIKYNHEGRAYYKGVYGSYNNYEDAQKALNNLPSEIKQGADIKSWSKVQENAE